MNLRNSSVAKRLSLCFVCLIMPIVVVNICVNIYSASALKQEITSSSNALFKTLTDQIDSTLSSAKNNAYMIATDVDLLAINNKNNEFKKQISMYQEYIDKMKYLAMNSTININVELYLLEVERKISSNGTISDISKKMANELGDISEMGEWRLTNKIRAVTEAPYLSFQLYVPSGGNGNGIVISIDIPAITIRNILVAMKISDIGQSFIMLSNNDIVSSNSMHYYTQKNIADIMLKKDKTVGGEIATSSIDMENVSNNKEKYMVFYRNICADTMKICFYFPKAEIMRNMNKTTALVWMVLLLSSVLTCFLIMFSYKSILNPLKTLVAAMREVGKSNLDITIPTNAKDEIGFMYNQFNGMVLKLNNLINEVYLEKIYRQQMKLNLYQSQINPHFLYNCLNFISQSAQASGDEYSAKMSMFLSKYFRYNTNSSIDDTTIRAEIDNIITYVQIQKIRFLNRVEFDIDMSDETEDMIVPKLIVQPLIENCFVHGLEKKVGGIKIYVKVYISENHLLIEVKDDSGTATQSMIDNLNDKINTTQVNDTSFGLSNINKRIQTKYGNSSGLYMSVCNDSVKATILIEI